MKRNEARDRPRKAGDCHDVEPMGPDASVTPLGTGVLGAGVLGNSATLFVGGGVSRGRLRLTVDRSLESRQTYIR